ncbi:hypothetical protein JXD38_12190, partial [candidate division WOR-3 bacterium]|nr:hypothetical protein [candidate division WOR-3 bacterium]
ADRVSDLLFGAAPEARRLRVFVRGVCAQTSEIRGECVCRTGRVDGLSRQMGEILLRRQALEREGRKPQIAAFLNRVRDARSNGIPEAQVRAMVREGLARGKLRPNADKECRAMQKRVEELGRQLAGARRIVAGESAELTQVSSRR